MKWNEYYEKINEWSSKTSVAKISALEEVGPYEEVADAIQIIAWDDEAGATKLLEKALALGIKFPGQDIADMYNICAEESLLKAIHQSADTFTTNDLDALYCFAEDDLLTELSKKYKIPLPQEMSEDYADEEEWEQEPEAINGSFAVQYAIEAADYALECLHNARKSLNASSDWNMIDLFTSSFWTSLFNHNQLRESETHLILAKGAVDGLNQELENVLREFQDIPDKTVSVRCEKLASLVDLWLDSEFMDCMTQMQIGRAQKSVGKAIKQVEEIRKALLLMKED